MFERLIRAPDDHKVPSSVLAVQRRMRKDVCDLTREKLSFWFWFHRCVFFALFCFLYALQCRNCHMLSVDFALRYYSDITSIEDHETCWTKTIPGKVASSSFYKGREVPGVASHIFLWTHSGSQGKAEVGLSKINRQEADMAIWLAYYLVQCGVPKPSIVILTPYKGQLMLIRKQLLSDQSSTWLLSRDPADVDQIRLSTVDRFQGDEGDVVIASLVSWIVLARHFCIFLRCFYLRNFGKTYLILCHFIRWWMSTPRRLLSSCRIEWLCSCLEQDLACISLEAQKQRDSELGSKDSVGISSEMNRVKSWFTCRLLTLTPESCEWASIDCQGNTGYFENGKPEKHWQRTFEILQVSLREISRFEKFLRSNASQPRSRSLRPTARGTRKFLLQKRGWEDHCHCAADNTRRPPVPQPLVTKID